MQTDHDDEPHKLEPKVHGDGGGEGPEVVPAPARNEEHVPRPEHHLVPNGLVVDIKFVSPQRLHVSQDTISIFLPPSSVHTHTHTHTHKRKQFSRIRRNATHNGILYSPPKMQKSMVKKITKKSVPTGWRTKGRDCILT